MDFQQIQEKGRLVSENIARVIVGRKEAIRLLFCALIAGGNVLLEDVPGTGKTKLAKALAMSIDADFARIQFTPDLLPSDLTGLNVYSRKDNDFVLRKGPVFTNILLADELNRATPRTQAGLLECMEEQQVTIDGVRHELGQPFFVIATQNPIETAGTYPLPEAQLDRFMMKLSVGLPDREEEMAIMERFSAIRHDHDPMMQLTAAVNKDDIIAMRAGADQIHVHPLVRGYIADITMATRGSGDIVIGASPRASLNLLRGAKVHAALDGRSFVTPDDVKALAVPVLAHRLMLGYGYQQEKNSVGKIKEILGHVNAPTEEEFHRQDAL